MKRGRTGAALAAVLLALALLSALVVGAMYVARSQAASVRLDATTLQPAAERALVRAVVSWDSLARAQQPVGVSVALDEFGGADQTVWVTKTAPDLYWLVAESRAPVPPSLSRRVGLIVRWVDGVPAPVFPRAWADLP